MEGNTLASSPDTCQMCGGKMEQGFIIDNRYGVRQVSQWAAGAPKMSIWRGAKVSEARIIPIGAYRCSSCGHLELYARREFAAKWGR